MHNRHLCKSLTSTFRSVTALEFIFFAGGALKNPSYSRWKVSKMMWWWLTGLCHLLISATTGDAGVTQPTLLLWQGDRRFPRAFACKKTRPGNISAGSQPTFETHLYMAILVVVCCSSRQSEDRCVWSHFHPPAPHPPLLDPLFPPSSFQFF